jgi:WD40 repeat protein
LHAPSYLNAVAWSFDGSRVAGLSGMGRYITVWDTKTWKTVSEFQNPGASYAFNSLAFLDDGSILTTPKVVFGKVHLCSLVQWNADTGKPVREIPDVCYPDRKDDVGGITSTYTVSKDGALIAGIGGKVGVMLFDGHTGKFIKVLTVPGVSITKEFAQSLAFSPDSKTLAVGTMTGLVYFFDLQSGSISSVLDAYKAEDCYVSSLAFSPDGQLIAAGKAKNVNLRNPNDIGTNIWRMKDQAHVASLAASTWTLQGKDEAVIVRTVSWTPDNILAVGDDNSLRLWHVDGDKPQLMLDKRMGRGTFDTAVSPQGMLAATDNDDIVIYQ